MKIGARYRPDGSCEFRVWGPFLENAAVKLGSGDNRLIPLQKDEQGYWQAVAADVRPGDRYLFVLNNKTERPDPASHFQPEGVHRPSQIVDHNAYRWSDADWNGIPLQEMIIYELHVGTFTREGTFEAMLSRLDELKELGVNTIEIMPVAQFPGKRNWGYDGVDLYAVQNSYGEPADFKRLIDACHRNGLAVLLDVVYNHLGPEGNYLRDFGPYFTKKYRTPWGEALNFDDRYSDGVRNFFVENALHWFENYHIDGLRLDAVHAIFDQSARPFLQELAERSREFSENQGRKFILIAESNLNDTRLIRPPGQGGFGLDAQWSDDFHHSVHTLLTGEKLGYYQDFGGSGHLVRSLRNGFAYAGEYSVFRKRRHGNSSRELPGKQFVICIQNHDQVGNRLLGERLASLVSFESLKLAAGILFLAPYIPMLFMGEEYGEKAPFLYFVHHGDPGLIEAVREGRKAEFESFRWQDDPPDPQSEETFLRSKIDWEEREEGAHGVLLEFYRELIRLRGTIPALAVPDKKTQSVEAVKEKLIFLQRRQRGSRIFACLNFSDQAGRAAVNLTEGRWRKMLDSAAEEWNGPGARLPDALTAGDDIHIPAHSFGLFRKEEE